MWPNWQDSFSVKSFVWISKTHENESGQMRLKKVKWAWYDAYLSQTIWNPTKKMTEIAQTARFIVFTMCGSWKSWSNGIAFLTTWLFQGFTKCGTLPSLVILNRSYGCTKSGQISRFFLADWRRSKKRHGHNFPDFSSILNQRGKKWVSLTPLCPKKS